MSNPYLGEIRTVGFNFPPIGWAFCDGALVSIADNNALYALIGTTYGGDGNTTFGLPEMRGRVPISQGQGPGLQNYTQGQLSGTETVTLITSQLPQHGHAPVANNIPANVDTPVNLSSMPARPTQQGGGNSAVLYTDATKTPAPGDYKAMQANILQPAGGSQPHENMAPYLGINFIVALQGVFPSRN